MKFGKTGVLPNGLIDSIVRIVFANESLLLANGLDHAVGNLLKRNSKFS